MMAYAAANNAGFFAINGWEKVLDLEVKYKIATMCFTPVEADKSCTKTIEIPDLQDATIACDEYCYKKHCLDRCKSDPKCSSNPNCFCHRNCFTYIPLIFCENECEKEPPDPSTCEGVCYQEHCIDRCHCSDPYCFCHSNCITYTPYIYCNSQCER